MKGIVYIVMLWICNDRGGVDSDIVGVFSNSRAAHDEMRRVRSAITTDKGERLIVRLVKHHVQSELRMLNSKELAAISRSKWE